MAITLNMASAEIRNGETKTLRVTPTDSDGEAVVLSTLTAVFTPPTVANAVTKNIGDFTLSGGVYSLSFTFNEVGWWSVRVTGIDATNNTEIEPGRVRVLPV